MPTEAQIREYLERSGDKAFAWRLPLVEWPNGWLNYHVNTGVTDDKREFVIVQAQGRQAEIAAAARAHAAALECKRIIFATQRNGRAFERLTGGRIVGYLIELPMTESGQWAG